MTSIDFKVAMTFEIFPDKVDRLMNAPDGPIGQATKAAAEEVLKYAKLNIGSTFGGHHPGPRLADTGKVIPTGSSAWVVSFSKPTADGKYNVAVLHHEGTAGHSIGEPGKVLVRKSPLPAGHGKNANGFFRRGVVQHTGTLGSPYLTDAVSTVGLRPSGTLLRGSRPVQIFRLRQA